MKAIIDIWGSTAPFSNYESLAAAFLLRDDGGGRLERSEQSLRNVTETLGRLLDTLTQQKLLTHEQACTILGVTYKEI